MNGAVSDQCTKIINIFQYLRPCQVNVMEKENDEIFLVNILNGFLMDDLKFGAKTLPTRFSNAKHFPDRSSFIRLSILQT